MPYDEGLAQRIREVLDGQSDLIEKKMFGGIAFLVQGNMCAGVHKDDLIVRLDPADYPSAIVKAHARPFNLTGRPMKGWLLVTSEGCESDDDLEAWICQGLDFVLTLPAKIAPATTERSRPRS